MGLPLHSYFFCFRRPGMELSLSVILFCAFAFLIAGFVDAVAGGGGLISMPALLLAGVPPHMALGSGKFATTLVP